MKSTDETFVEFRARVLGARPEEQVAGGATDLNQPDQAKLADLSEAELDDLFYQGYQDELSGETSRRRAVGMVKEDVAERED